MGTAGYYRKFQDKFAEIAMPLTRLLQKGVKFEFDDACLKAFETLKDNITKAPVLAYFNPAQVTILTTDGSGKGLGVIVFQSPDGSNENERVVSYASRSLRKNEGNKFTASHMEAYAVTWGVKYFRHYLAGREFILKTDHSSFKWIFENPNPSPKVHRWAAAMMGQRYIVRFRKGSQNPADSLSRMIRDEDC